MGDALELLARLLDCNPKTRISVEQALEHPFFKTIRVERRLTKIKDDNVEVFGDDFKKFLESCTCDEKIASFNGGMEATISSVYALHMTETGKQSRSEFDNQDIGALLY